jgi:hypothetical protein
MINVTITSQPGRPGHVYQQKVHNSANNLDGFLNYGGGFLKIS